MKSTEKCKILKRDHIEKIIKALLEIKLPEYCSIKEIIIKKMIHTPDEKWKTKNTAIYDDQYPVRVSLLIESNAKYFWDESRRAERNKEIRKRGIKWLEEEDEKQKVLDGEKVPDKFFGVELHLESIENNN